MVHIGPHKNAIPLAVTHEAWLVVGGIVASILLIKTDIVAHFATFATDFAGLVSFGVGMFFTSILTTTPAIVAITELASYVPPWKLALVGGAGAVCGDLMIFRFVRSPLAQYLIRASSNSAVRRFGGAVDKSIFWWIVPALGAVVIASPLPDEIGLLMMGLSHIRMTTFVVLAYVMNSFGIYLLAIAAQTLLT